MEPAEDGGAVAVTLENGATHQISVLRRRLPSGTGRALFYFCPLCQEPCRYLYRLALSEAKIVAYGELLCQRCANLRFASQGWYRPAGTAAWGPRGRSPWDPLAISDPRIIAEDIAPTRR
jgi:hypothetical protein